MKFIMPACSIKAGHHIDQTFAILDLSGAGSLLDLWHAVPVSWQSLLIVDDVRHLNGAAQAKKIVNRD